VGNITYVSQDDNVIVEVQREGNTVYFKTTKKHVRKPDPNTQCQIKGMNLEWED